MIYKDTEDTMFVRRIVNAAEKRRKRTEGSGTRAERARRDGLDR